MLNLLLNKNLYSTPYVLNYSDLLDIPELTDIQFKKIGIYCLYTLYYKSISKKSYYKMKNATRYENNYINGYLKDGYYRLNFKVPKTKEFMVECIFNTPIKCITGSKLMEFEKLLNKKVPTTKKQSGLSLFILQTHHVTIHKY